MSTTSGIRDFIYMDVERVRSIVAQRSGGLLSERVTGSEHDAGGKVGAEGGFMALARASGEADYHYRRSQSETRSLHDALFSEFFACLDEAVSFLERICPHPTNWREELFVDGALLAVPGVFRIVDYEYQAEVMRSLPGLYELLEKSDKRGAASATANGGGMVLQAHGGGRSRKPSRGQSGNRSMPKAIDRSPFANVPLEEAAELIDRFYKSVIRIKVFPFREVNDKLFVGSADRSNFRMDPRNLMSLYGTIIDAGWTAILQVNKGIEHDPSDYASQTGNLVEDKFEVVANFSTGLASFVQGVKFPAVAMTPIAVYRDV